MGWGEIFSEIKMKLNHLTYCLCGCKSIVPVALFVVGFLCSIRNNNRRILNVKMSSEVGNIVLGKDCQKKSKSEIPHFFLSSNFMIFTYIFTLTQRYSWTILNYSNRCQPPTPTPINTTTTTKIQLQSLEDA